MSFQMWLAAFLVFIAGANLSMGFAELYLRDNRSKAIWNWTQMVALIALATVVGVVT